MGNARQLRRAQHAHVIQKLPVQCRQAYKDERTLAKMVSLEPTITLDPQCYVKTQQSVYERLAMFAGVKQRTTGSNRTPTYDTQRKSRQIADELLELLCD